MKNGGKTEDSHEGSKRFKEDVPLDWMPSCQDI